MQNYFLLSHLDWLIESISSFLFSISSVEMKWYRNQAAHTLAPFLLSPEVSDSCRFFGPSLPPGCLTVLCCHGNKGSEASSCDWYAAEVFPNLTPWLPLPILLPPVCCCLPLPPLFSCLMFFQVVWADECSRCVCVRIHLHRGDTVHCPAGSLRLLTFLEIEDVTWSTWRWERSFSSDRTTQTLRPTTAKKRKRKHKSTQVVLEDVGMQRKLCFQR